jgi:hypothetical protein
VYKEMRDELVEMVGPKPYDMLCRYLDARVTTASVPLPHPAVRPRP